MSPSPGTAPDARKTLTLVVALALLSVAGIIGMLLIESAWDWAGFVLAALPLLYGGWRWWAQRGTR